MNILSQEDITELKSLTDEELVFAIKTNIANTIGIKDLAKILWASSQLIEKKLDVVVVKK
jgi:hypothetical protein